MKKFLLLMIVLLFAFNVSAAQTDFKVLNNKVFEKTLELSNTKKSDLVLYKKIFKALAENDIERADRLTLMLEGDALLGHVLAQKYQNPAYKANYEELAVWLKKYPFLPQYNQLKSMSIVMAPGYVRPKPADKKIFAPYSWYREKYEKLSAENRLYVRQKIDDFLAAIRKGDNEEAAKIMKIHKFRMTIPDKNYDAMSATLASAYLHSGDAKSALKWTTKAVKRSKDATAAWWGGLAAWINKDYKLAAYYFETLGNLKDDEWLTAAGSYWAYRSYLKLKKPDLAAKNLRNATKHKRNFYGILAGYLLSGKVEYDWDLKSYYNNLTTENYINEITSSPNIRRAILLLAAEQDELAEEDLKANYKKLNTKQKELILFMSRQYNLANLSYVVANNLKNYSQNIEYDSFVYPMPLWSPEGGWVINPAWIWALARQESLFAPKAMSHAGACGIMQVMPATAAQVANDPTLKKNWTPLLDKYYNISIGQNYIQMLRDDEKIGDNLFYLAASYNAGPHNVKKWFDRHDFDNDPLLFIEMIPWKETRLYVKRILANYWIYNSQMGQESQSLQQILDGKWPMLDEFESSVE